MLGVIIGDIIGSIREGKKSIFNDEGLIIATEKNGKTSRLTEPEPILHDGLSFTDDTVLMLATEKALSTVNDERAPFAKYYTDFFDMHSEPNEFYKGQGIGYGMMFMEWATSRLNGDSSRGGYQSYGNGSAMRVAPVAYRFDSMVTMLNVAKASAMCTHDHIKGVEGAQMVALATWAARQGLKADEIRLLVEQNSSYNLSFDQNDLIKHYFFQPTCEGSVPHAIWAALEGPDFESVMRRCLLIGGDTDTIAAIAGGLAELLYGISEDMQRKALDILRRDGPFLYDEYSRAIKHCKSYPDYITLNENQAGSQNKKGSVRSLLRSLVLRVRDRS